MPKQPWIGKPLFDVAFILAPPFLSLSVILIFPSLFANTAALPDMAWVLLILLVDVAHVYSTLYRTYLDPGSFKKQKTLLTVVPFAGFVTGVLLYSMNAMVFWKILAYVAVFHFVRQQYGFMRVYSRYEAKGNWHASIDTLAIYAATLYPVLYWHFSGPRNFHWFIEGDFTYFSFPSLLPILSVAYGCIMITYLMKEGLLWKRDGRINLPRLAVVLGTAASWFFGIVYFNGDLAFTLLNVVSHGIPYMAMIWLYGEKNYVRSGEGNRFLKILFRPIGILLFLGILFLLAFVEEGLWDTMVWKEHDTVFSFFTPFRVELSHQLLSILVPLLALPQITHYILDGFIWRSRQQMSEQ